MANHCSNWITISGKKENVKNAIKFLQEWLIDMYNALPNDTLFDIPLKIWSDYEKKDVYKAFGTKWIQASTFDDYNEDDTYSFNLESAWSPVNPFLLHLVNKFKIEFVNEYEESSNGVYGRAECIDEIFLDIEMCKGEYYAKCNPELIEGELEYFDKEDLKFIAHLLTPEEISKIKSNEHYE